MRSVLTCKTFSKPVPMKFDPSGVPQRLGPDLTGFEEIGAEATFSIITLPQSGLLARNKFRTARDPRVILIATHKPTCTHATLCARLASSRFRFNAKTYRYRSAQPGQLPVCRPRPERIFSRFPHR